MFKRVLLSVWMLMIGFAASYGQTTIIGPTTNNGGFEDATNTAWQFVNGTALNKWVISTGATPGFSGTKAAYVSQTASAPYAHTYNLGTSTTVHMYQDVTLPAGLPVVNLSFKKIVGGESSYDFVTVYISNGAPGAAPVVNTPAPGYNPGLLPAFTGYTPLGGYNLSSTWTNTNIAITAAQAGNTTVSTTRRILFIWSNDGSGGVQPPVGIDDVLLTAACSGPVGLNATAIGTNSATLNWTALVGATGYNVRYKKISDPVTVPTWATPTTVGAGVTSLPITGLTALSTQYEFQVSANGPVCNNYNGSATFTTLCGLATLPYTEDFEGITANNQLPLCMAATSVAPYVYTYTAPTGNYNQTNHTTGGNKFASFRYGSNDWLFTPSMNLTAGTTYKFSFWYITDGLSGWDSLKVGMGASQTAAGMTQQFTIATGASNTTYQQGTQNFTPTASGTYSFGIKVKATSGPWYLSVDDLNVIALTPCTGTPLAEVISPSAGSACPGGNFTLSSSGANSTTGGIAYQWQSAPSATGPWTNIAGATNGNTLIATGISTGAYYRLQATCVSSGLSSVSNTANITVISTSLPYTEDFEGISVADQLPQCMAATSLGNMVRTNIVDIGTGRNNHTPGGSKYGTFSYSASDWLFTPGLNLTAGSSYKFSFWYVTDGVNGWDSLKVGMGNSQTPAAMTQQFTVATSPTNTNYVQVSQTFTPTTSGTYSFGIKVVSQFSPDYLSVDDINISLLPPCAGTPPAEVVSPSVTTVCSTGVFTLRSSGATGNVSGITYQWQSSATNAGPWTNIAGATNGSSYTKTGISVLTFYRLQATCTNGGLMSTSNVVSVKNSILNCYCNSAATSTGDEDILNVTLGTLNSTSTCTTTGTGPNSVLNRYSDYTTGAGAPAAPNLTPGTSVPYSVTIGTCGGNYSNVSAIYIDWNQNGSFADAGETIFASTAAVNGPNVISGSTLVPANAVIGLTRMRVINIETSSTSALNPCASYSWGETEDYLVNIFGTPPPPTVTNSGPLCAGKTVNIIATSNTLNPSFTLTGGTSGTITNNTGVFTVPTPLAGATVTYSVTVTDYGFTSTAGTTVVTLYPTAAIAAGVVTNPTTCAGADGSIQITGAGNNTSYTLRYNRNGINIAPLTITTTATGTYTLSNMNVATYDSIRLINVNGCISNNLGPISLVPPVAPPPPAATYDQPLCLNSTLTLRATNPIVGAVYNWYGPGGYTSTGAVATRLNVSYADTGNYGVTINVGGCVSAQNTFKVYITPPSPVPTTAPLEICQNSSAASLTATGSNLLFYTALTGGTGSAVLVPASAVVGTTTYYVTQSSNGCESRPRVPLVVTVKLTPGAPSVPNGGNIIQCQFDAPALLPATGVTGATFLYYTTATGGIGSATLMPRTDTVGVLNYYVSQLLNGCESSRSAYTVTTKPKPAPPIVVSPVNICQFAIVGPLTATGQNINWYENPAGGVPLLAPPVPETNISTPKAGAPARDSFFATQTVNGCESDRALIDVSINYQPNATFVPSKRFVCVDDTISFVYYGNADNNATYSWFIPKPQGREVTGQNSQGPFVAQFDSVGIYDVRLIVSSDKGCVSTPVTQRIEVRDRPQTRINAKREICLDEVVEISLDSMSELISDYRFEFDGGKIEYGTDDAGPYGVSWNTPGPKQIVVNSTSRFCGSRLQAEIINVRPAPAALIQNKPSGDVCASDSIRLQANDLGPGYAYTWTPSNIFQDRGDRGTTVFITPLFKRNAYAAVLTVTDSIGCIGKDSVTLITIPCCNISFPNAFTPNNDGLNDRFGQQSIGVPSRFTMRVMNRWGKVIFETSDALESWDGSFSGEAQPSGTYFFYAKYRCSNGQDYEQKGEITLIR